MKINIFKITAIMLIIVVSASSCKDDNIDMSKIDFSNIENLYTQPLPVIQRCVEGKWQWTEYSTCGFVGLWHLTHTFVDITKDSVIVTQDGYDALDLDSRFSYSWEKKKTNSDYTTYVLLSDTQNKAVPISGWYFDKILNDTLYVFTDAPPSYCGSANEYLFLRVK